MRIEMMKLSELLTRKHLKNPKEHDVPALLGSFARFGFTAAPTIDETSGILVAGHGRCEALEVLRQRGAPPPKGIDEVGTEWMVPVVRDVSFANDEERDAYVIADNQHTITGGWNLDALTEMLGGLASFDGLGFEAADLSAFGIGSTIGGDDQGDDDEDDEKSKVREHDRKAAKFTIVITCDSEADRVAMLAHLKSQGHKARASK